MKDVYVGGMPQFAGTFGVRYFVNYWFLGANVNGFARNYIEVAPLRRLSSNYASVESLQSGTDGGLPYTDYAGTLSGSLYGGHFGG